MSPSKRNNTEVIVVNDLWTELGMVRLPVSLQPLPSAPLRLSRPWQVSLAAVVLTIVLHILLGLSMFTNFGGVKVSQHSLGTIGQVADQSANNATVSVLILISDESSKTQADERQQAVAQAMVEATEPSKLEAEAPPVTEPTNSEGEAVMASNATGAGSQPRTLEDIYIGQIKARIERAWSDSQGVRMAVGNCKVNIQQGKQGEVIKVNFGRCFATPSWKETLAQAIRYASPLPAPPDEKVFTEEVTLGF